MTKKYVETVSEDIENLEESVEKRPAYNAAPVFGEESNKRFGAMSGFSYSFEVPLNSVT